MVIIGDPYATRSLAENALAEVYEDYETVSPERIADWDADEPKLTILRTASGLRQAMGKRFNGKHYDHGYGNTTIQIRKVN
jgi:hypothetical protein